MVEALWVETAERIGSAHPYCNNFVSLELLSPLSITTSFSDTLEPFAPAVRHGMHGENT